ncbi:MAG: hypothetical protein KC546_12390, partial [Anaerolineae bacterium]|nr:hypothetical protein [Anaerolineae bacterium]
GWGDDQQTLYIFQFMGYWTWEDLHQAAENIGDLLDNAPHPINLIFNFADSFRVPRNGINELSQIARKLLNNLNMMILVGMDPSMQMVSQTVLNMHPRLKSRVHTCCTFAEAMKFLEEVTTAQYDRASCQ